MGNILNKCPCCGNGKVLDIINDWQGGKYSVCSTCKSWYQNPVLDYVYEENYWGTIKDPDGNIRDLTTEREFKIKNWYCGTVDYVNSLTPGKILDVGAGLGFFLSSLSDDWNKHALDVSDTGLSFIKSSLPNVTTHKGMLSENTFEANSFDVVMFYHVIEHVPNPQELLATIYKILKPGGKIIIGTPNIGSFAAKRFKGNFRLLGSGHLILFNPKSLENLATSIGFKKEKYEFPFWKTDYVTFKNLWRLFDETKLSPPFEGNVMTLYLSK
jgi:2-polyprenyl-3-methyl-5-hydroxy-6-metoxy-1,4-benzoquinol methylase